MVMARQLAASFVLLVVAGCGEVAPPRAPVARVVADAPADEAPDEAATPAEAPQPVAAPVEGCTYTATPAGQGVGGISILGVTDGADGYDMPDICPMQACGSGLTIQLPKADDWSDGAYDLTVATDLGTLRCHVTRAAPPPRARPARCANERELSFECAGPPDPAMGPIMISGAPQSVRVTIAKDGALLADATLAPRYSNLRWDGFDCDPSCRAAAATVDVR